MCWSLSESLKVPLANVLNKITYFTNKVLYHDSVVVYFTYCLLKVSAGVYIGSLCHTLDHGICWRRQPRSQCLSSSRGNEVDEGRSSISASSSYSTCSPQLTSLIQIQLHTLTTLIPNLFHKVFLLRSRVLSAQLHNTFSIVRFSICWTLKRLRRENFCFGKPFWNISHIHF